MSELIRAGDLWIRNDNVAQDMEIVNDIYHRDAYRTSFLANAGGPTELVVDVGAHIGAFSRLWHKKNPEAMIAAIEVCPENIAALKANTESFATIFHGACTYDTDELMLLNAVFPNCASTGGSIVAKVREINDAEMVGRPYLCDRRPIRTFGLEEIMDSLQVDYITVLKLDCEGSEFSILEHATCLDRVAFILGEYHGGARWEELRSRRFSEWSYGHMCGGSGPYDLGIFHLRNPRFSSNPEIVSGFGAF